MLIHKLGFLFFRQYITPISAKTLAVCIGDCISLGEMKLLPFPLGTALQKMLKHFDISCSFISLQDVNVYKWNKVPSRSFLDQHVMYIVFLADFSYLECIRQKRRVPSSQQTHSEHLAWSQGNKMKKQLPPTHHRTATDR